MYLDITKWVELVSMDRPGLLSAIGEKFVLSQTSVSPGVAAWLGGIEMQSSAYAMEQALISLRDEDLREICQKSKYQRLFFMQNKTKLYLMNWLNKCINQSLVHN